MADIFTLIPLSPRAAVSAFFSPKAKATHCPIVGGREGGGRWGKGGGERRKGERWKGRGKGDKGREIGGKAEWWRKGVGVVLYLWKRVGGEGRSAWVLIFRKWTRSELLL